MQALPGRKSGSRTRLHPTNSKGSGTEAQRNDRTAAGASTAGLPVPERDGKEEKTIDSLCCAARSDQPARITGKQNPAEDKLHQRRSDHARFTTDSKAGNGAAAAGKGKEKSADCGSAVFFSIDGCGKEKNRKG